MDKLHIYLEGCEGEKDQVWDYEVFFLECESHFEHICDTDVPLPLHGHSVPVQSRIVLSRLLQTESINRGF